GPRPAAHRGGAVPRGRRDPRVRARGRATDRGARAASLVLVVESREPRGQALDGDLEVRVQIDEQAELFGEPREGEVLVAPAGGEFLDPSVREVHQANARSMRSLASVTCTECEPTAVVEDSGRVM